jgi:polar amino acid transport system substrate-binding protein
MRPVKALLFFFAAGVLCAGCANRRGRAGLTIVDGVLLAGLETGYPPMEYYDAEGGLAGFDIELTKALAGRLGLEARFADTAWEGILAGLDAGRYDIALNITILPERRRNYRFTRPCVESAIAIVTRRGLPVPVKAPEDLAGLRVACQGDTSAEYFAERLERQGVVFAAFSYDKILNCFDDLAWGRVDAVVADSIAAFYFAEKENSPFEVVWQGPSGEYIGICLKKGNDALAGALDAALDGLFEDGTMARLSLSVFGRDLVSPVSSIR